MLKMPIYSLLKRNLFGFSGTVIEKAGTTQFSEQTWAQTPNKEMVQASLWRNNGAFPPSATINSNRSKEEVLLGREMLLKYEYFYTSFIHKHRLLSRTTQPLSQTLPISYLCLTTKNVLVWMPAPCSAPRLKNTPSVRLWCPDVCT